MKNFLIILLLFANTAIAQSFKIVTTQLRIDNENVFTENKIFEYIVFNDVNKTVTIFPYNDKPFVISMTQFIKVYSIPEVQRRDEIEYFVFTSNSCRISLLVYNRYMHAIVFTNKESDQIWMMLVRKQ